MRPNRCAGTGTVLPHGWPSSQSGRNTPTGAPQTRGLRDNRHHHARADGLTAAQEDERPQSTLLVLGTRLSPLLEGLGPPPARPRPGPVGSRPRCTNSARTTSRPETRIIRRTGDPPSTPHHVLATAWYEADAAVHSNYTFTGCGRTNRRVRRLGYVCQGMTQQGCQGRKARDDYPITWYGATPGPASAPPDKTAPRGTGAGS
jgi:hypothetical protein